MPKYWKEKLDIETWRKAHGGKDREYEGQIIDNLVCPEYLCVEVCKFTFRFSSIREIEEYIEYFSTKVHPSTRSSDFMDHYDAQTKFTRLPGAIKSGHNRERVLKALNNAVQKFMQNKI